MRKGFVSYSHRDRETWVALRKHLVPLSKHYAIEFWWDEENQNGDRFDEEIAQAIERASVHIVLLSEDSMCSEVIQTMEIPAIQRKERESNDLVNYVVLNYCYWKHIAGTTVASPRDSNNNLLPLQKWPDQNEASFIVAEQIERAIRKRFGAPN